MQKYIITLTYITAFFSQTLSQGSSTFLINGQKALPFEYPFVAHISYFNETSGNTRVDTAVLISDRHLLAKSEFLSKWGEKVDAVLGAQYPLIEEATQQRFVVLQRDIIYRKPIVTGFDIAILPLPKRAIFNAAVQPILLPRLSDKGEEYVGQQGIVAAWTGEIPERVLAFAEVEISRYSDCGTLREPETLCVAREVMSAGDNGAPIVLDTEQGRVAVAIFSYYAIFKKENEWIRTNVFIKLNEHLDFIAENTGISIRP